MQEILNIGCGFRKFIGAVNVDKYPICEPDIIWDLDVKPWTWALDDSFDVVIANHVMEHLKDWWGAFGECARVLKPGGKLKITVSHPSNLGDGRYRDGMNVITPYSFWGIEDGNGILPDALDANAFHYTVERLPMKAVRYSLVPYERFKWMCKVLWLLNFAAMHMRGFIWTQAFEFEKINGIS
jgi:SAM-dependent methyltransferase